MNVGGRCATPGRLQFSLHAHGGNCGRADALLDAAAASAVHVVGVLTEGRVEYAGGDGPVASIIADVETLSSLEIELEVGLGSGVVVERTHAVHAGRITRVVGGASRQTPASAKIIGQSAVHDVPAIIGGGAGDASDTAGGMRIRVRQEAAPMFGQHALDGE